MPNIRIADIGYDMVGYEEVTSTMHSGSQLTKTYSLNTDRLLTGFNNNMHKCITSL